MTAKNRQLRTAIGWAAITALSVTAGLLGGWHAQNKLLLEHLTAARHYASAFLPEEMPGAGAGDLAPQSPLYLELKHRLERRRQVDPQVRQLYLLRHDNATGRTTFIADSQPENSQSLLHPGDEF